MTTDYDWLLSRRSGRWDGVATTTDYDWSLKTLYRLLRRRSDDHRLRLVVEDFVQTVKTS